MSNLNQTTRSGKKRRVTFKNRNNGPVPGLTNTPEQIFESLTPAQEQDLRHRLQGLELLHQQRYLLIKKALEEGAKRDPLQTIMNAYKEPEIQDLTNSLKNYLELFPLLKYTPLGVGILSSPGNISAANALQNFQGGKVKSRKNRKYRRNH